MDDAQIIDLFWLRSENAIAETANKYGSYCYAIAFRILCSREDSDECVDDTYLKAWEAMPPQRPGRLRAFLGKITRNLSLDRLERQRAAKRGGGQLPLVLEELQDCLGADGPEDQVLDRMTLTQVLNEFLAGLPKEQRVIFLRRYWYLCSVREIAQGMGLSESKVKMTLMRTREKLRKALEKEGVAI